MKTLSNPVLKSIIDISEKCRESKLADKVLDEVDEQLALLSEKLRVEKTEALFFALIFALQNQNNEPVNLHQIADFLDYPFLHILEYRKVIDILDEKSLICLCERGNGGSHTENNGYKVMGSVSNSIIDGEPIAEVAETEETLEDAINEILAIGDAFRDRAMDLTEYVRQIIAFENEHKDLDLIRNISEQFADDVANRILLYYFCYTVICGEPFCDPNGRGSRRCPPAFTFLPNGTRVRRKNMFNKGTDILIKNGYVEKYYAEDPSSMRDEMVLDYRLTNKGLNDLFGEDRESYSIDCEELTELDEVINSLRNFSRIYEDQTKLVEKYRNLNELETEELLRFDYFKKLLDLIPDNFTRWFYIDCVSDFTKGYKSCLTHNIKDIFGHGKNYFETVRSFIDEKHFLLEAGLLEIEKDDNIDKTAILLTDRSVELLYGENADLYKRKNNSANIMEPEKLKEKTLFYTQEIQEQIDMLGQSLEQKNLDAIQKRLESKGLSKGFAAILYGAPGTGKTETVIQLAKKTDRKILHVDIADSKSMWFGESEKLIKKIFTNYRALCKSCKSHGENTPILLFNEADALISKRNNLEGGGARQTENAIQNILLEEMENLDGIMIATTNLSENMDAAFERRFLFKIKYSKPDVEVRGRIWMNKLQSLSEKDACALAKDFDFSGGEIDNIVRKAEMDEIITGVRPDYGRLFELCQKERLEKAGSRMMGFAV